MLYRDCKRVGYKNREREKEKVKCSQSCLSGACLGLDASVKFVRRYDSQRDN